MGEKEEKSGDSGDKGSNANPEITIKVDGEEKTFGTKDVENLLAQQASATQKTQEVAVIIDAAKKYGLDPTEYVERAEGAFATVVGLIDDEVLDEEGKRISVKKEEDPPKSPAKVDSEETSKELVVVTKALDEINKRTERLEKENLNLMQENLSGEIRKKHKELDKDDVSRLLGTAMSDQRKNIWQHAEELVEKKKEAGVSTRAQYAKEFNIDLEKWDENKVKEQDAKGGGAASVLGKRKLSFRAKAGDADAVTPMRASMEFLAKQSKK